MSGSQEEVVKEFVREVCVSIDLQNQIDLFIPLASSNARYSSTDIQSQDDIHYQIGIKRNQVLQTYRNERGKIHQQSNRIVFF